MEKKDLVIREWELRNAGEIIDEIIWVVTY